MIPSALGYRVQWEDTKQESITLGFSLEVYGVPLVQL